MSNRPSDAASIRSDLKIIVIGSSGAGKTSFVTKWTKNTFQEDYKATVVSEFGFKIYPYKEKLYRIQLWDIGGQDKSPTMAKIFSRDSHGCVVISDSTDLDSLKETIIWKDLVAKEANFVDGEKLPVILVQNKIDLIKDREDFEKIENETKNLCDTNDFDKYFMTSVKKNVNVEESMTFLIERIIYRLEQYAEKGNIVFNEQKPRDTIKIRSTTNESIRERKKNTCC
jgi:small GTP-binding protein